MAAHDLDAIKKKCAESVGIKGLLLGKCEPILGGALKVGGVGDFVVKEIDLVGRIAGETMVDSSHLAVSAAPRESSHGSSTSSKICRDFLKGKCIRGNCHFSHASSFANVEKVTPSTSESEPPFLSLESMLSDAQVFILRRLHEAWADGMDTEPLNLPAPPRKEDRAELYSLVQRHFPFTLTLKETDAIACRRNAQLDGLRGLLSRPDLELLQRLLVKAPTTALGRQSAIEARIAAGFDRDARRRVHQAVAAVSRGLRTTNDGDAIAVTWAPRCGTKRPYPQAPAPAAAAASTAAEQAAAIGIAAASGAGTPVSPFFTVVLRKDGMEHLDALQLAAAALGKRNSRQGVLPCAALRRGPNSMRPSHPHPLHPLPFSDVTVGDLSVSGVKDKVAITHQWLGVRNGQGGVLPKAATLLAQGGGSKRLYGPNFGGGGSGGSITLSSLEVAAAPLRVGQVKTGP
jgi:hypothetical protein